MGKWKVAVMTTVTGATLLTLGTTLLAPTFTSAAAVVGLASITCMVGLVIIRQIQSTRRAVTVLAESLAASSEVLHDVVERVVEIEAATSQQLGRLDDVHQRTETLHHDLQAVSTQSRRGHRATRGLLESQQSEVDEVKAHTRSARASIKALRSELKPRRQMVSPSSATPAPGSFAALEKELELIATRQAELISVVDILRAQVTGRHPQHLNAPDDRAL